MRNYNRLHSISTTLALALVLLLFLATSANAQKKERLRLSATYTKEMNGPLYLDFQATARIDQQTVSIPDVELGVFYEVDGEEFTLGKVNTDSNGKARYTIKGIDIIRPDSTGLYILGGSFAGNNTFRPANRTVEFRDASLEATLQVVDSVTHVYATLKDTKLDSLVADAMIKVQVQRMFKPLVVSEEFLMTDEEGSILVAMPNDVPGRDSILTLEVVIDDNDDYGNIKTRFDALIGIPIVEDTTYHERSLWAPRGKTPLFILFFTGILIVGSWGVIIYLIMNLYKIAKTS